MVLIFTQYYTPAFKAGGPITSIANLLSEVHGDFKVLARGHDLNEIVPLAVELNKWTNQNTNWYIGNGLFALYKFCKELRKQKQNCFYINGIFDIKLNLIPIIFASKLIIAPRGMLHKGTVFDSRLKKFLYLYFLRFLVRNKSLKWHATDDVEATDIKFFFGKQDVTIIPNLVQKSSQLAFHSYKRVGHINLVYYSLISDKKNLLFILKLLSSVEFSFEFHIYGPEKDIDYASRCKKIVIDTQSLREKVFFHGAIQSGAFAHIAKQFDYFILPTLGENYGHAIAESLSYGLPVIISNKTPWIFENNSFCYSLSLDLKKTWQSLLFKLSQIDAGKHKKAKEFAYAYYYQNIELKQQESIQSYQTLFQL